MALGTNHWKLGVFITATLCIGVAAALAMGLSRWNEETIDFVSYFDESVQGLDIGSPVKYRGVTVGRVAEIDIAPDLRHVEVTCEVNAERVGSLNLRTVEKGEGLQVHEDMKTQLAQTGITGVKFILIDFFEHESTPRAELPFPTPPNFIPSAPSTLKNIEDSILRTGERLPEIADDAARTMARLRMVADQIEEGKLPEHAKTTLVQADVALSELTTQLRNMHTQQLSMETQKSIQQFNQLLVKSDELLERISAEQGILHNAESGMSALGEVARGARTLGPELELTLREVRGAARSIKRLADTLERDPDMLLKGRAK